jgi:hypothetical protein
MGFGHQLFAGDLETVVGIVAIMVWLVIQGIRKASGKRPGQSPPPPDPGGPQGMSPEEELRRFLQDLGQGEPPTETLPRPAAAPPTPPPAAPLPPPPVVVAPKPQTMPPPPPPAAKRMPPPARAPLHPLKPTAVPRPVAQATGPATPPPAPALTAAPAPAEVHAAAGLPPPRPSRARLLMRKPHSVREAVLLGELLGGPVAMREGSTGVPVRPAAG